MELQRSAFNANVDRVHDDTRTLFINSFYRTGKLIVVTSDVEITIGNNIILLVRFYSENMMSDFDS